MKTEEIEEIVNRKILKLFYKLIELTPIKVSNSSFYYDLNGEIIELGISTLNVDEAGYKFPELHRYSSLSNVGLFSSSFKVSDKWGFYINLPRGKSDKELYNVRQVAVPAFDELELLDIKKKLLLKQQMYELTLLDKYLDDFDKLSPEC